MKARIVVGNCRIVLKSIPDCSIDSIVTDPPYELGFMGKAWDRTGIAIDVSMWRECLRVLKPGGHLLSFGGSRTYHRMACAIEDAGFEIRDQIMWLYGSGFPKSLDVSKAIDKAAGVQREVVGDNPNHRAISGVEYEGVYAGGNTGSTVITAPATAAAKRWTGWGTALKPAHEPIVVARKPLIGTVVKNILEHGTGALNIDGCRIETSDTLTGSGGPPLKYGGTNGRPFHTDAEPRGVNQSPLGRWPANVIHDGSEEVVSRFPDTSSGAMAAGTMRAAQGGPGSVCYGTYGGRATETDIIGDSGSAARFFYTAKADREERNRGCYDVDEKPLLWSSGTQAPGTFQAEGTHRAARNNHPTVKPIDLMRYLCRLVTPPGGTVLDHFVGSGSTGVAALMEELNFYGIDINGGYASIAEKRMKEVAPLLHEVELSL